MADDTHETNVVKDSPVGPGVITGYTPRGYPQVDGVAVGWLVLEDGTVFDPHDVMARHLAERNAK